MKYFIAVTPQNQRVLTSAKNKTQVSIMAEDLTTCPRNFITVTELTKTDFQKEVNRLFN